MRTNTCLSYASAIPSYSVLIWCRGFYVQNILLTWISWHNCFVCGKTTNDLFCNPQAWMLISANIIYLQSKTLQSVSVNKTIVLLFINMQTNKELMTWSSWLNICVRLHGRLSTLAWVTNCLWASKVPQFRGFGGQRLAHLPFTSEAAGSNLTKYILNATRTQSSCEKSKVNALPKVVGFPRVLRFPPTGKVDRVG
jgi:hypothetical protein